MRAIVNVARYAGHGMTGPGIVPVIDEGLGNSTYLFDLGRGDGLVVDPSRDLRTVRAAAEQRRLRVRFAVDTPCTPISCPGAGSSR